MSSVFVAGIAGSGKTALCRQLADVLGAERIGVGALACSIADRAGLAAATIEATSARALSRCQELVAQQFAEDRSRRAGGPMWLLDGHLVLVGAGRAPFLVPETVLRAADVDTVILCDTPAGVIARRIAADPRPRPPALRSHITERAAAERDRAVEITRRNGWQLIVWDGLAPFPVAELDPRIAEKHA